MRRQFEKQFADYAKLREERILEQRNMRRDAARTALFQADLTPKKLKPGKSSDRAMDLAKPVFNRL